MKTAKEERIFYNALDIYESALQKEGWEIPKLLAQYLNSFLKGGELILDVGCGPGLVGMELANLGWQGKLIGTDIAEKRLCEAALKSSYTECVQANVYRLPFKIKLFDIVTSSAMVGLTGPRSVLEMWRVLKTDGILACVAVELFDKSWSPERFKKSLQLLERFSSSKPLFKKDLGTGYTKSSYADEHYFLYIVQKY